MSKSNSPKNAITHGLYATDIILTGEDKQQFDDLTRDFLDEHCPDGVSEEAAVIELASLHWKRRRFEAGVQQALQKQQDLGNGADANDLLLEIAHDGAKSQHEVMRRVSEQMVKQAEQICKPNEPNVDSQCVEFEKLIVSSKEFNLVFGDLVSSFRRVEEQKLAQIEQAYRPHILEKELKIQAEIDRRIEKVLKRLVIIKELKRQYPAKSVSAKQIEATKLSPTLLPNPVGTETNAPDVVRPAIDPEVGKDTKH
jgi:hypothetical protein